jgi:hypothetical protein
MAISRVEAITVRDVLLNDVARTNRIFLRTLGDLTEDEMQRSPAGGLSPVIWQVGHVAVSDAFFVRLCGSDITVPDGFDTLFGRGTGGVKAYPSFADIKPLYERIQTALEALTQSAEMDRAIESKNFKTVADALSFNCFHRGYHIGKICTLRALMGRQPLFN